MSSLESEIIRVKSNFEKMSTLTSDQRTEVLRELKSSLLSATDDILKANQEDCDAAKGKINQSLYNRLVLDQKKIEGLAQGIEELNSIEGIVGKEHFTRELEPGLTLKKIAVPLGVLAIIFESRPDAMVQILSLILKSGNVAILKGGREARHTISALADVFNGLSEKLSFLPAGWFTTIQEREQVQALLQFDQHIDLVIPRGSNQLVSQIMGATRIPVLGHADGICHIFVSSSLNGDVEKLKQAKTVICNSKVQYPAACNAVETVLIDQKLHDSFLAELLVLLKAESVEVFACEKIRRNHPELKAPTTWSVEYSDLKVALRMVENLDQAVEHINQYGSHHTDCILSRDKNEIRNFLARVDSASVFANVSTRFADGFRMGMGAEVGISTSKTHARGPVGIEGLVTYKYLLEGDGQTVN